MTAAAAHGDRLLLPESVASARLPANLVPGDEPLFARDLERALPAVRLRELRNVRVSPEGMLFRRGSVLPESFAFAHRHAAWARRRRSVAKFLVLNYAVRRAERLDGPGVWIADEWSVGYFHWLMDALPRLSLVRDRLNEWTLVLPHRYRSLPFVEPSLAPFGVGRVRYLAPGRVLSCAQLFLPTHVAPSGHHRPEVLRGVREALLAAYGSETRAAAEDRIYVSRGAAGRRRIADETEVVALLERHGFRVVRAESRGLAEQVRLASRARLLVSNHGAGLANMLFMASGGSVLELRHETDDVNNCYFTLASALGLEYFYQTCPPVVPGEDPHVADLRVDLDALARTLERMLGAQAPDAAARAARAGAAT